MLTIDFKKSVIQFLSLCFITMSVMAANAHVYLGSSLIGSFASLSHGSPKISYVSGATITDTYPLNNTHASTLSFSVNGGYQFSPLKKQPAIALGLGFYSNLNDYHYKGKVYETASGDTRSALYHYKYKVKSTRAMAEIQFAWMLNKISPFIDVGVGFVNNRLNNYQETAINHTGYSALPPFQSNTKQNVAYQVGGGVKYAFNFSNDKSDFLKEQISVGYHYVNLGTTSFNTRGVTYPYRLHTGLLTTNDAYVSYTHLF